MMGSNPEAARFSGISNSKSHYNLHSRRNTFSCCRPSFYEQGQLRPCRLWRLYVMQVIIICVLGGVSPNGGFGSVAGVTVAILILQILSSGFNMFLGISNFYRSIIWGAVLLLAVAYNHISSNIQQNGFQGSGIRK